jgi:hypothetical protein
MVKEGFMRRLAVLVSITSLVLLIPASASAGKPVKEPLPLPPVIELPGVCPDFGIVADILVNREYAKTWMNANGDPVRTITNGTLKVRLTEPDSGTSIVRNISGPGTTIFHADGSSTLTARGTWFFFFFPGDLGPGSEPMSIVNTGRIVIDTDPNGTQSIRSRTGRQEDICATLGG